MLTSLDVSLTLTYFCAKPYTNHNPICQITPHQCQSHHETFDKTLMLALTRMLTVHLDLPPLPLTLPLTVNISEPLIL